MKSPIEMIKEEFKERYGVDIDIQINIFKVTKEKAAEIFEDQVGQKPSNRSLHAFSSVDTWIDNGFTNRMPFDLVIYPEPEVMKI
jgi:hypothetical protein